MFSRGWFLFFSSSSFLLIFKNIHRFGKDLSRRAFSLPQLAYQNIHISFYLNLLSSSSCEYFKQKHFHRIYSSLDSSIWKKNTMRKFINCGSVLQGKGGGRKCVRNGPCQIQAVCGMKGWGGRWSQPSDHVT